MNKDGTFRFKIPVPLEARLRKESERSGLSFAEILRRALDTHLRKKEKEEEKRPVAL